MKTKLIAALFVAAAAAPFAAQAQNAYVGASVGRSELKASSEGFSEKERDTGFKVFGGYQFNQSFGIEGGYVNLGEVSGTDGTDAFSIKPASLYVAATGTLPVGAGFSLFAKAGVAANRTKASVKIGSISASDTESKTTGMVGVGAAYAVAKNISLTVEYENFGKVYDTDGSSLKTSLLSFGARFQF